jgi:hypothetical protein
MIESEMGNRGSKSNNLITLVKSLFLFLIIILFVKEQRVDGSYCIIELGAQISIIMQLRYTLTGFERNYQGKIPSKQTKSRPFSTSQNSDLQFNNNP